MPASHVTGVDFPDCDVSRCKISSPSPLSYLCAFLRSLLLHPLPSICLSHPPRGDPSAMASMDAPLRAAVSALHASPTRAVVHLTGGGGAALAWLLSTPGCSATLLEATVPYAASSLSSTLAAGAPAGASPTPLPASAASAATARRLAAAAYRRAVALAVPGTDAVGVGATAALVSGAPRRGTHRVYVAARSRSGVTAYGLTLAKGAGRGREAEDALVSRLVLQALVDAGGGGAPPRELGGVPLVRPALGGGDELHVPAVYEQPDVLAALLAGRTEREGAEGGDAAEADELETVRLIQYAHCLPVKDEQAAGGVVADVGASAASLVLPGSFNPLHRGHRELLAVAAKMRPVREVIGRLTWRRGECVEGSATVVGLPSHRPRPAQGLRVECSWRPGGAGHHTDLLFLIRVLVLRTCILLF